MSLKRKMLNGAKTWYWLHSQICLSGNGKIGQKNLRVKNYLCVDLLHSQTAVSASEREIAGNEIVCSKFTIIKRMISHFEI